MWLERYGVRGICGLLLVVGLLGIFAAWSDPTRQDESWSRELKPLHPDLDTDVWIVGTVKREGDKSAQVAGIKEDGIRQFTTTGEGIGRLQTPFYKLNGPAIVQVHGHANEPRVKLTFEILDQDEQIRSVPYQGKEAYPYWMAWRIPTNDDDIAVRIIMSDESDHHRAWVGVSIPYTYESTNQAVLIISVFCLALLLYLGTGLAIWGMRRKRPESERPNFIWVAVPGMLLMAVFGFLLWKRPPEISAAWIAIPGVAVWSLLIAGASCWQNWDVMLSRSHKLLLVCVGVMAVLAVARGVHSTQLQHELFGHTISRSAAAGLTPDSRISYHNVQVTLNKWVGDDSKTKNLFSPFWFAARGPIAGWAISPVVALYNPRVPIRHPDQAFEPFDPHGFMTYRICMSVMLSLLLVAIFGVFTRYMSASLSLMGCLFVGFTPFLVHETFFTWPKLAGQVFTLLAFLQITRDKPYQSGVWMGVSYLFHPMAILVFPFVGLWKFGVNLHQNSNGSMNIKQFVIIGLKTVALDGSRYILGVATLYVPWMMLSPGKVSQGVFFKYIVEANGVVASSFAVWLEARWQSFANTFIPFYQYFFYGHYRSLHSPQGHSSDLVRWYWQYWTTLPFGIGLTLFPLFVARLYRYVKPYGGSLFLLAGLPFFVLLVCFGSESCGLTRNSGHAFFIGLMMWFWWAIVKDAKGLEVGKVMYWLLNLRFLEVLLLVFTPLLPGIKKVVGPVFWQTDVMVIVAGIVAIIILQKIWRKLWLEHSSTEVRSPAHHPG